uniref:Uncharacterized protein n=1 Tax=Candidatus Kentrum sp. LPFa TaxID=2126335 RepID=A0A450WKL8_9GAMM|nr:MAG: hypothetical protein BECKLPF1236B_GA0070989_11193 [Candidatus Kentron sp. LPFa]
MRPSAMGPHEGQGRFDVGHKSERYAFGQRVVCIESLGIFVFPIPNPALAGTEKDFVICNDV